MTGPRHTPPRAPRKPPEEPEEELKLTPGVPVDITSVSLTALKALAYDLLAEIEQRQNTLRVVNERIAQLQKGG